jgi:hypothetical protein
MTLAAVGNSEKVSIFEVGSNFHSTLFTIPKPKKYFSKKQDAILNFKAQMPVVAWGRGQTPKFSSRTHSLLAVAWGPLIQLMVFVDHEESEKPFILDGYYVLSNVNLGIVDAPRSLSLDLEERKEPLLLYDPKAPQYDESASLEQESLTIHSIEFIQDSTIMVLTEGQEMRVLYT